MKQADLLKVLAADLGTSDVTEINKLLRAKDYQPVKYRITGKGFGHYGYTCVIKAVVPDGLKIYNVNKVIMIKFAEIEAFAKAKARIERPKRPKIAPIHVKTQKSAPSKSAALEDDDEDDDYDDDEDEEIVIAPVKEKKKRYKDDDAYGDAIRRVRPRGSKYIPKPKKKP